MCTDTFTRSPRARFPHFHMSFSGPGSPLHPACKAVPPSGCGSQSHFPVRPACPLGGPRDIPPAGPAGSSLPLQPPGEVRVGARSSRRGGSPAPRAPGLCPPGRLPSRAKGPPPSPGAGLSWAFLEMPAARGRRRAGRAPAWGREVGVAPHPAPAKQLHPRGAPPAKAEQSQSRLGLSVAIQFAGGQRQLRTRPSILRNCAQEPPVLVS